MNQSKLYKHSITIIQYLITIRWSSSITNSLYPEARVLESRGHLIHKAYIARVREAYMRPKNRQA